MASVAVAAALAVKVVAVSEGVVATPLSSFFIPFYRCPPRWMYLKINLN